MKECENEQKGFPVDTGVIKYFHGRCQLGRGRHNVEKGGRAGKVLDTYWTQYRTRY